MDAGADCFRRDLSGDDDAFIEIMDMYRMGLIFFINRFVGDYHAAEDISMECFVYLLVHKHRYNFKSSFKTYLYSIARHKSIDYIRRESRYSVTENDISELDLPDVKTLEDSVIENERQAAVHDAMKKLN